jgi:predicted GH43/DUF377 family glycosyl hydrolase
MMTTPTEKRLLIEPSQVPSAVGGFEVVGVFNPGAAVFDGRVVLLVRVAERSRERRDGHIALPRWNGEQGRVVDWLHDSEIEVIDPRVVRVKSTGTVRLTFTSHLRVAFCGDGKTFENWGTAFIPERTYEAYGIEDPRITQLDDRYWITYVAVSPHGAATALASTTDFQTFHRHGIIFPPENKDVALFPRRISGRFVALHRPNGSTPFTPPEIWLAYSHDLLHWGGHRPLRTTAARWNTGRVGGGCPPLRVGDHWLEVYHGNEQPKKSGGVGRYVGAAMLLDSDDPAQVIAADPQPWLEPTEPFERDGFIPDVVFPTGIVEADERLLIYYGGVQSRR